MNKKYIKIGILVVVIIWMGIIFYFSSQPNAESTETSAGVLETIINILPNTKDLSVGEQIQLIEKWQPMIRKMAHFSIYTLGGIVTYSFIHMYQWDTKKEVAYSSMLGLLYAISDEIHQAFIPGRSCQITDVGIDFLGILLGICIALLWVKVKNKQKTQEG